MSGTITTGNISRLLMPGLNQLAGMAYKTYDGEYKEIFTTFESDKGFEDELMMMNTGLASVKAEGGSISFASFKQGSAKRYVHVMYATGFSLTLEAQKNEQYALKLSTQGMKNILQSMQITKEIVAANVLNNATSTSNDFVGADGAALLSASHALGAGGGTASNLASADISELALEDMCIAIASTLDDAGKPVALKPAKLIIPVQSQFIVDRILLSPYQVDSANHNINALQNAGLFEDVCINHYLTDNDMFIVKTNLSADEGFKHFQSLGYTVETDNDFSTKNMLFTAHEEYSFGFTNWRCAYGSMGI